MTGGGRKVTALAVAALLAAPGAAAAQSDVQDPPRVPTSAKSAKRCKTTKNRFASFRVFIVKGKSRITCRKARSVVRAGLDARGYTYFDWTKAGGGPGPWSDVWEREDERVVVTAIVNA
jgi:hypothetical protein